MSTEPEFPFLAEESAAEEAPEGKALRVIGWFSAGMVLAALSFFVGAELRSRYKFKRRTPYDFYANAGKAQAGEFGMGV